jgi:hypothetical protein
LRCQTHLGVAARLAAAAAVAEVTAAGTAVAAEVGHTNHRVGTTTATATVELAVGTATDGATTIGQFLLVVGVALCDVNRAGPLAQNSQPRLLIRHSLAISGAHFPRSLSCVRSISPASAHAVNGVYVAEYEIR